MFAAKKSATIFAASLMIKAKKKANLFINIKFF